MPVKSLAARGQSSGGGLDQFHQHRVGGKLIAQAVAYERQLLGGQALVEVRRRFLHLDVEVLRDRDFTGTELLEGTIRDCFGRAALFNLELAACLGTHVGARGGARLADSTSRRAPSFADAIDAHSRTSSADFSTA